MARNKAPQQDVALEVVCNIGRAAASEIDLPTLLELIYRETGRVMDTAGFAMALYDPLEDGLRFELLYDQGQQLPPLLRRRAEGWGLAGRVFEERRPLLFQDLSQGVPAEAILLGEAPRSWLGVPLVAGERSIGVVSVQSYAPEAFAAEDQSLLEAIASQAAVAIENLFLRRESERRIVELSALNQIGQAILTGDRVEDILETIYRETSRVMDTSNLYVAFYHPAEQRVTFDYFIEDGQRVEKPSLHLSEGGLTVRIVQTRQPLLLGQDLEREVAELGLQPVGRPALSYLGVPMLLGESVLGVIAVQSPDRPRAYDRRHQELLSNIANQAAIAIENVRLSQERERRITELSIVNEVGRALASSLDLDTLLETIYEQVGRLFDTTNFYIALYDSDLDQITFAFDVTEGQVRRPYTTRHSGRGMTEYIIRSRQPLLITRHLDQRLAELGIEAIGRTAFSWLGVPLIVGERVVGVMAIQSYEKEGVYGEDDLHLFSTLAGQAASAIDNARLLADHERRIAELSALNEIGRAIIGSREIEEVFEAVYQQTSRVMDTSNLYVALYEPEQERVLFPFFVEDGRRVESTSLRLEEGGLTVRVVQTRQPLLLGEDMESEMAALGITNIGRPARSYLGVPMLVGEKVVGVIAVQSPDRARAYDARHRDLLGNIANLAAVALENTRLSQERERRITELATLTEISRAVSSALALDELLNAVHEQVSRLFDTTNFFIGTYEAETDEWTLAFCRERGQPDPRVGSSYQAGTGLTGHVLRTRRPLLLLSQAENAAFHQEHGISAIGDPACSWMGVPLITADRLIGVMAVQSYEQENLYSQQDLLLFSTIAAQVAPAVESARLVRGLESQLADLSVLNDVARAIVVAESEEELLKSIHRQVARVMDTANFYVALYDQTHQEVRFAYLVEEGQLAPPGRRRPLSAGGVTAWLIQERKPLFIEHSMDALLREKGITGQGRPALSYMGVPMIAGDQVLGAIAVQSYERERAFDARHLALFTNIATQAALAIQRIRLRASESRKARQLAIIGDVSRKVTAILELDELLQELARSIQLGFGYGQVAVFRVDEESQELVLGALVGRYAGIMDWGYRQPMGEGLVGWAASHGEKVLVSNVTEDPRFIRGFDAEERTLAEMCVPIAFAGRVIGVLDIQSEEAGAFDQEDLAAMETLAGQLAAAMRNAMLFRERGQQLANLNAINRVIQAAAGAMSLDDMLTALCDVVVELMSPDGFFVALRDAQGLVAPLLMDEGVFYRGTRLSEKGFTDYMIKTGVPLLIRNMVEEASRYPVEQSTLGSGRPASSWLGVPLRSGEEIIGAIVVNGYRPFAFDDQDRQFLEAVAGQVVVGIEKARLFEETQRALENLRRASEQQRALLDMVRELSTPLVPITEGILVLPLVGTVDSQRAQQIMEVLLKGISAQQAQAVILDITGVPVVDTSVANYLLQATQAVRLLGAECVLVGITPEVAQTLVGLGVDLRTLVTRSDLQGGVEYALRLLGRRIVKPARRAPAVLKEGAAPATGRTEPAPRAPSR